MKQNSAIRLKGLGVVLVPYRKYHVEKYHKWMMSSELQKLTASEPLTIEEEHEMQQRWFKDDDKCTFIVLDDTLYRETNNEVDSMIGDTNLFLNPNKSAEIEVMIAERDFYRKRKGWNAVLLMLRYGVEVLNLVEFTAKISLSNLSSKNLFLKLKFVEESYSNVFQEHTYKLLVTPEWKKWLLEETKEYSINPYPV